MSVLFRCVIIFQVNDCDKAKVLLGHGVTLQIPNGGCWTMRTVKIGSD